MSGKSWTQNLTVAALALGMAAAAGAAPARRAGRPGRAPAPVPAVAANQARLLVDLDVQEELTGSAPRRTLAARGDGQAYAYFPGQDGMRYAWVALGPVRQVRDVVRAEESPAETLAYLRGLLENTSMSREAILALLRDRDTPSRRTRYQLDARVPVFAWGGAFTVRLELPGLGSRAFERVNLRPGQTLTLNDTWDVGGSYGD